VIRMPGERMRPVNPREVKPIDPRRAVEEKLKSLPEEVIASFNELIAEKLTDDEAVVRQDEVIKRMREKGLKERDIYDKGWLDVEGIYEQAGWKVRYDRPVYYGGENFEPYYTFNKGRTRRRRR
jgi:hypothetical protein